MPELKIDEKREGMRMRRSKLETYVAILNVLANRGPLKLTHIVYKANVNCSVLKDFMDFLVKNDLVEERLLKRSHAVFAITQRGVNVLKYFRELTHVLPIVEETRSQTNRAS
jgi:predicted transcriptional regulator